MGVQPVTARTVPGRAKPKRPRRWNRQSNSATSRS